MARGSRHVALLCAGCHFDSGIRRALVDGIGTDNRPLRFPMVPYRILEEQEVAAIFAYLRRVPALRQKVPSPEPYALEFGGDGAWVSMTFDRGPTTIQRMMS